MLQLHYEFKQSKANYFTLMIFFRVLLALYLNEPAFFAIPLKSVCLTTWPITLNLMHIKCIDCPGEDIHANTDNYQTLSIVKYWNTHNKSVGEYKDTDDAEDSCEEELHRWRREQRQVRLECRRRDHRQRLTVITFCNWMWQIVTQLFLVGFLRILKIAGWIESINPQYCLWHPFGNR